MEVSAGEAFGTGQSVDTAVADRSKVVMLPFKVDGTEYYIEDLGVLPPKPLYSFLKRLIDLMFSILGLIVMVFPMCLIALAVKMDSEGPVFYRQERLGLNGRKINVIKFRSMSKDAENNVVRWSEGDNDPRITKVGRFLRKTRLDELPQLFCILSGEMSLVGPRPEREVFYDAFETYIHGFHERLKVVPGLTGWAQVNGGYDLRPEEKIVWDVEYIKNRSIGLDLKIIFKTVGVVLNHDGAK